MNMLFFLLIFSNPPEEGKGGRGDNSYQKGNNYSTNQQKLTIQDNTNQQLSIGACREDGDLGDQMAKSLFGYNSSVPLPYTNGLSPSAPKNPKQPFLQEK